MSLVLSSIKIGSREQAVALFTSTFTKSGYEELRVAYLDEDHCLIALRLYGGGGPTMFDFPLRAITQEALMFRTRGMVMAHNHPSGDPSPSQHDIDATKALVQAITPHQICLYDHLILAGDDWRSLRELGLIDP